MAGEAEERIRAVSNNARLGDVYGPEWCAAPPEQFRRDLIALLAELTRLREENGRLYAAVGWVEPPFVDERTPADELRKRIAFLVTDAATAEAFSRNLSPTPQEKAESNG